MLQFIAVSQPAKPVISKITADGSGFFITDIGRLFQSILTLVLFGSALLVFAYLIYGGVEWILSGGDKGKTEAARNKITAALVGMAIVASAYALMNVVAYFFGIDVFNLQNAIRQPFN